MKAWPFCSKNHYINIDRVWDATTMRQCTIGLRCELSKWVRYRQGCRICGILGYWLPGTFFLPGTFCEKMNSAWKGVKVKDTFFARNFYEKMKSAWRSAEVRDTILAGTFCEKMKSAWKSAEVKDTFLPGTFCDKMKSAWKGAEVKDTFWLGTFMKRKVFCISVPHEATCKCIFHDNWLIQYYLSLEAKSLCQRQPLVFLWRPCQIAPKWPN